MDKTLETELAAVRPKVLSLARKFIRSSGLRMEAEDIAQEALVRLWTACRDGAEIRSVEAWATTVTKNLCVTHLRKLSNRAVSSIPESIPSQDTASSAIETKDNRRIVAAALNQIPPGTRQLLQLRTAGMSLDEIAIRCNFCLQPSGAPAVRDFRTAGAFYPHFRSCRPEIPDGGST